MSAIAPNKATQFEAVAKYWKKSIVLALFRLWQKLNCVQRLFIQQQKVWYNIARGSLLAV